MPKEKNGLFKKIIIILYLVMLVFYAAFMFVMIRAETNSSLPGYSGNYVCTPGNVAGVKRGDMIISARFDPDTIGVGDFVVVQQGSIYRLAQIASLPDDTNEGYEVTEYNNQTSYVPENTIVAYRRADIKYMGYIVDAMYSVFGVLFIVILPCVAYIIAKIIELARGKKAQSYKREKFEIGEKFEVIEAEAVDVSDKLDGYMRSNIKMPSSFMSAKSEPEDYTDLEPVSQDLDDIVTMFEEFENPSNTPEQEDEQAAIIADADTINKLDSRGVRTKITDEGLEILLDNVNTKNINLVITHDGRLKINTDRFSTEIKMKNE
ncbi:MAG: hypothetical protein FWH14_04530 [Oscillospiraceae bacterium]|nr:hypothetical protein [Oscillospiraceae bacterium]